MIYGQPALETIMSDSQGYQTAKPGFLYINICRKEILHENLFAL